MLSLMRKHAGSWIIKFLLGAVIIAFIPFGYGLYQDRRGGQIASVDGEPISYAQYLKIYNNLLEQMRQSFGDSLTDDMIKALGLKDRALNQLIEHKLMLSEAKRLKFRVSDQEVADAIGKIEVFQTGGVFDRRRYEYILNRNRMTTEEFETQQKESMLIDKVRSFITGNLTVSDAEAMEWYQWNNASLNIEFVLFDPNGYKGIDLPQEEIATYYDENKQSYKKEAKVKVRYIFFDPEDYVKQVAITENELQEYYQTHKGEFHTPKTVEARHILINTGQDADSETVEKAKTKALDILKMAQGGKDFADLARQYSEGPSKDRGGYLGVFKYEDMVKPFSEKAFSMKPGEISDPVRTQFGWHIIKVEKINEATTVTFENAKEKIQKTLTAEKAKMIAYDEAEAVYDESFVGDDMIRNAKERNLQIQTTGFFDRQGPDKGIKNRSKFASAAFNLELMEISDIQDLGDGYCILQVMEKIPEKVAEFNEVQAKVAADLKKQKQDEKAREDAKAFLSALMAGASISSESAKYGLKPEDTGFFNRNASIPKIGYDRAVTETAFKLSEGNNLPLEPVKGQKGYYVIRFKTRKEPSADGFETQKATIKQSLVQQKTFQTLNTWLAQLRNNSEIDTQENLLE